MDYVNLKTGLKLSLDGLTQVEKQFYQQAQKKFNENVSWLVFDEFVFGMKSPIYLTKKSHLDVIKTPLFLALKDMSLQLGVQQGMILRRKQAEKEHKSIA